MVMLSTLVFKPLTLTKVTGCLWQQPTHTCRSAMILRFPKPVIRDVLHKTPRSHWLQTGLAGAFEQKLTVSTKSGYTKFLLSSRWQWFISNRLAIRSRPVPDLGALVLNGRSHIHTCPSYQYSVDCKTRNPQRTRGHQTTRKCGIWLT